MRFWYQSYKQPVKAQMILHICAVSSEPSLLVCTKCSTIIILAGTKAFLPSSFFAFYVQALTLCMLGNFSCFCCCLLIFFKINLKKKNSGTLLECQTVWIQIRTDRMLVLIWVQTVFKDHQQTTKFATSKERVKHASYDE